MSATLSSTKFDTKTEEAGKILRDLSTCDDLKAEFLLLSLPSYYNNLVENIRTKDFTYGDVVRQLNLYVPQKQSNRRKRMKKDLPRILLS